MNTRRIFTLVSLAVALAFASAAPAQDKPGDKKPAEPKKEEPAKKPEAEPEKKPESTAKKTRTKPVKDAAIEKRFGLADAGLTAEQREKLNPFLKEQAEKIQAMRSGDKGDRKGKLKETMEAVRAKLKDTLTAEQFEKWDKANGGPRKKKTK